MTKKIIGFISIFLLGFIWAYSNADEISSPTKAIRLIDNFVFVQGRWKKTTQTKYGGLSRINSTYITCDKKSMTCTENTAILATPQDDPILKEKFLYIVNFNYQIINWSNDVINAKYEALVADVEIKISIKDNFAERRFRETKARGSETADPNVYGHWILE